MQASKLKELILFNSFYFQAIFIMAYVCDICGKSSVVGRSQQHQRGVAGKRWKKRVRATFRLFRPNLQRKSFLVNGEKKQMRVCTKCLKAVKNKGKVGSYKNISVI